MQRGRIAGYSLYELLMTTMLAAVILFLGLPAFEHVVAEQRLRTEVDRLFHAVHLARKSSIVRRRVVAICPRAGGDACAPDGGWSEGWLLFVNKDRDDPPQRDADEPVLASRTADVRVRISANRRGFAFRSTERRATNGTVLFCDRGGRAAVRALVVSYTGRPRVARTDRRGKPYRCPD